MFGSLFKSKSSKVVPSTMLAMPREVHEKMHREKCRSCACNSCKRCICCRCLVCEDDVPTKSYCSEKQELDPKVQYCAYY